MDRIEKINKEIRAKQKEIEAMKKQRDKIPHCQSCGCELNKKYVKLGYCCHCIPTLFS